MVLSPRVGECVGACGVCVAVVHPTKSSVLTVVVEGKKSLKEGGESKEKRKSKKGGARKSVKKGETQIHFQKHTKKQKAQLTLAD